MIVVPYPPGIARLDAKIQAMNRRVTRAVMRDARRYVPVDTGTLRASIHMTQVGRFSGQVWVGTDHWQPQEYGSSAHHIYAHGNYGLGPRTGGRWAPFYAPSGHVFHPGTPEVAFMRRALYQKRVVR
jgi:hypothetical protein